MDNSGELDYILSNRMCLEGRGITCLFLLVCSTQLYFFGF